MVFFIIYAVLGYWATGQTIYVGKVVVHDFGLLFLQRLIVGTLFGWILIPVAVIKLLR